MEEWGNRFLQLIGGGNARGGRDVAAALGFSPAAAKAGRVDRIRDSKKYEKKGPNTCGSGRHMSPNTIMNVRPTLHYVGPVHAGEASVGPKNGGS